jgi:hypothetical protein
VRRAFLIALALSLVFPAAASACTIAARPAKERVDEADLAVWAKVISSKVVATDEATGTKQRRYRLRVLETYKGRVRRRITILAHDSAGTCGIGPLRRGQRLGLVLEGERGPWRAGLQNSISRAELRSVRRPRRS